MDRLAAMSLCWSRSPCAAASALTTGEALIEAAALGLGIALQPDFIVEPALASGTVEAILEPFAPPALGIHALLPAIAMCPIGLGFSSTSWRPG